MKSPVTCVIIAMDVYIVHCMDGVSAKGLTHELGKSIENLKHFNCMHSFVWGITPASVMLLHVSNSSLIRVNKGGSFCGSTYHLFAVALSMGGSRG